MSNNTKPAGASGRVLQGGGWRSGASYCRDANRSWDSPGYRDDYLGFRPVIRVTKQNVEQH